ncbi:MAG: hypothetical protein H7Y37_13385 [Anaerolineae bacterium]|nr:hypothetical protein [Gloeobacterales cyanobacterium ES-bin-313]
MLIAATGTSGRQDGTSALRWGASPDLLPRELELFVSMLKLTDKRWEILCGTVGSNQLREGREIPRLETARRKNRETTHRKLLTALSFKLSCVPFA